MKNVNALILEEIAIKKKKIDFAITQHWFDKAAKLNNEVSGLKLALKIIKHTKN